MAFGRAVRCPPTFTTEDAAAPEGLDAVPVCDSCGAGESACQLVTRPGVTGVGGLMANVRLAHSPVPGRGHRFYMSNPAQCSEIFPIALLN